MNHVLTEFIFASMSLITFDWSQIAYIGSPLATPWWAEANIAVGFVFFFWILVPVLYYSVCATSFWHSRDTCADYCSCPALGCLFSQNVWFAQFMPISSRNSFDNTGAPYDVTRILNDDSTINLDKYRQYSPLFLSTTFAISVSFHEFPKRCI